MKLLLRALIVFLIGIAGFLMWYWLTHSMDKAFRFSIGDHEAKQSLLIAYQGSSYKNEVVTNICEHFSTSDVEIRGMDISGLDSIQPEDWTAVFIFHTWEMWQAPTQVSQFHTTHNTTKNIVYFTTSDDGSHKLNNVDAITSASTMTNAEQDAQLAIVKLEAIVD